MKPSLPILVAAALIAFAAPAVAVDSAPAAYPSVDTLAAARARIAEKNWAAAIAELRSVGDTGNADWNNLMGYSLRRADPANYAQAETFYEAALRIAPRHRGALAYSGELHLITGNLAMAEQRLAALDKACLLPCDEFAVLKRAVARYKAAGNKYVAE